ncbi:PadR family transcriptional regulator [Cohnella cholangitidis]|uniref:PadR family transcriptional regulator n=1 Tax=Cohnella cholangitidis TaxID=2598458 RepID=A0A7G5BSH7_9BACL|nr:helix-turn-helix transcriptional regulator [Cohnella cholangitidis]QMV39911.1 PadR family transcriptional regulator [Cohnella cholangitidis]
MNSQDVILGMLMKQSRSGYEIKQALEGVFTYFYQTSYGTIYPTLSRMEQDGLITKENVQQEGKPNKNVYTITELGKERFNEYMDSPVESSSFKSDFLMRLFFGEYVGEDRVIAWLKEARTATQSNMDRLSEIFAQQKNKLHPSKIICIQMGLKGYQANLETIDEGLASLERLDKGMRD